MKKFTKAEQLAGDRAFTDLSDKARTYIEACTPQPVIYEYDGEGGEKLYAYEEYGYRPIEGLTFEQLQNVFEGLADEYLDF